MDHAGAAALKRNRTLHARHCSTETFPPASQPASQPPRQTDRPRAASQPSRQPGSSSRAASPPTRQVGSQPGCSSGQLAAGSQQEQPARSQVNQPVSKAAGRPDKYTASRRSQRADSSFSSQQQLAAAARSASQPTAGLFFAALLCSTSPPAETRLTVYRRSQHLYKPFISSEGDVRELVLGAACQEARARQITRQGCSSRRCFALRVLRRKPG